MLKERREIVTGIYDRLNPAEASLDAALRDVAALNAHLPLARVEARLAMEVGHEAFEAMGEAQQLLLRARAKMIEGHRALAMVRDEHRFPAVADGGGMDKRPPAVMQVVGRPARLAG